MRIRLLLGALIALLPLCALAGDRDGDAADGPPFFFAAGAMMATERSVYLGGDDRVLLLPLAIAQLGPVYLRGPAFGVFVYARGGVRVATGIALDLTDTDRGDSPQLADMADLDRPVFGEVAASFGADWGEASLSFGADVSGAHDGYVGSLAWRGSFEVGGLEVGPGIGIKWSSAEVNRYYYGVQAIEEAAGRPRYEPGAGLGYEFGLTVAYPFAERHTLRFEAAMELVPDEVSDSPIVARDSVGRIGVGYIYRF